MDYSKLSDREINALVNKLQCPSSPKDYCGFWSDGGPIIFENRIGIEPSTTNKRWVAQSGYFSIAAAHENPLRAGMIVYLMMQESEG